METQVVEPTINIRVDFQREAYRSFFDHQWAKELMAIGQSAPRLEPIALELGVAWKGAANMGHVPWALMDMFEKFAVGFAINHAPNTSTVKLMTLITETLASRLTFDSCQMQAVRKAIVDICHEAHERVENHDWKFPTDMIWKDFLEQPEFGLILWASQRNCYSALYFAYEHFLVHCLGVRRSEPGYRLRRERVFRKDLKVAFGDSLAQSSWIDDSVSVPRLVRNALSHTGGRLTDELGARKHPHTVLDGVIQITATEVKALYDCLKMRAKALVEHAGTLPEFR